LGKCRPIDNILAAVRMEEPERVAVTALEQEHAVSIAGIRYSEFARDPKKLAETHLLAVRRYSLDWVWIHVDDWIAFEPMGVKVRFFDDKVPTGEGFAVKCEADIDRLRIPDPHRDGRIPVILEGIRLIHEMTRGEIMICGALAAPFSTVTLLRGLQAGLIDLYRAPQTFRRLMDIGLEVAKVYAEAQIEGGAHALWVGDCMASSRIISERHFREFALPYIKRLIEEIRRMGGISILFTDEKDPERLLLEVESNPEVIAIGTAISIAKAKEVLGDRVCICGNVDPVEVLLKGSREDVERATSECIESGAVGGGYFLNTGECTARDMPPENMRVFVETALKLGKYPLRGAEA